MSKTVIWIRYGLGFVFCAWSVLLLKRASDTGGAFGVIVAVIPAGMGAACLYPLLIEPVASAFANLVYPERGGRRVVDFSVPRMHLANHEYDEAIETLDVRLDELQLEIEPGNEENIIEGQHLRATILYDHMHDASGALATCRKACETEPLTDRHARIIMLGVDILIEEKRITEAIAMLEDAIDRLADHPHTCKQFEIRLDAIA